MENTIAITPSHACDPSIAIAACRAGGLGLLDVGLTHPDDAIRNSLHRLATYAGKNGRWGIRWDTLGQKSRSVTKLQKSLENPIEVLLLAGVAKASLAEELKQARQLADQVFLEARSLPEALAAQNTGYDGIIIKGHEAGGGVGRDSSFIMAQHLHRRLKLPFSIQGGIGPNTAAAARLAGATGVVLCEQLWLTEESPFSKEDREIWAKLDGSETTCVGKDDEWFRFYSHSGRKKLRELDTNSVNGKWYATLRNFLTNPDDDPLLPLGQDIAFAQTFAQRFGTVGRAVTALNQSMSENVCTARQHQALAANAPLAQTHGTTYPIVQGPMTRVSDVAPFCKAVADGGGLPFLALALMRAPQVHELLKETQAQLGAMPWGVGILGFVPLQLRQEQLEVIKEFKPPFAIIAGGRPNQAAELEAIGISTYLHVPSPGLLEMYLKEGARKFIFEGRECGGHVGPRTSFTLWESAIQILLNARLDRTEQIQILFAGGISDSLSAAMVATIAAPLTAREMKIGVLMGTSYLFTEEAVRCGAITKQYQKQALACKDTTLLTSGIGHAVRCALTPYAKEFDTKKNELIRAGKSNEEVRLALERLNLGRLRIASKGVTRDSNKSIVKVDTKTQQRDGMYMIGDVASLYKKTFSIVDLHAEVSKEHQKYLSSVEIVTTKTEEEARKQKHEDIAIVGMACLFPGASNVKEYWHNILNRVDAIQEVSTERWNPDTFYDPDRRTPDKSYSKWGGFIRDIQFDPLKYGIPPASLKSTEPMQLLALETAWQALKDAGYHKREFPREKTSVIFGVGGTFDLGMDYVFRTMLMHHLPHVDTLTSEEREKIIRSLYEQLPEWTEDSFPGFLGNVFAGRIANRLNLMGSNFTIDAACASSLAAVEVASRQLQAQLCDLALVGTADGNNNPFAYLSFSKTHALSPHGRCRTFDDSADGIVISEGVAAMVLKRLPDAERDGDRIYAVIKGVGSSSDGRNKSLTAPHPAGQVAALQRAYEDARISPDTVQLVEAHGTGTAVGDKAEIQSLNAVFDGQASASQYCAVGSVKSMIGHTKIAAGMAGLMKCVLALKHRTLPATIGVEMPNSHVDFSRTPFYINTENRPWLSPHQDHPRRAAVSAFGFGGTNFHAVLEEYKGDCRKSSKTDFAPREAEIYSMTRNSRAEVQKFVSSLSKKLENIESLDLAQLAYCLFLDEQRHNEKHKPDACRLDIVAMSLDDLKNKLKKTAHGLSTPNELNTLPGIFYSENPKPSGKLCFLFPGQGSQRVNMLRDLAIGFPDTQSHIEHADDLLKRYFDKPLSGIIYPLPVFSEGERSTQQKQLNATQVAQPAMGLVDLVAFDILACFGLQPEFVAGHSYGEYVALSAAGAISRDDLLRLSAIRGQIVYQSSKNHPGTMAAVQVSADKTSAVIEQADLSVWVANLNAPNQTIIAGEQNAIAKAVQAFNERGLSAREIPVTAAFHTPAMQPAGQALSEELAKIHFQKPEMPVFSNTTAQPYPKTSKGIRELLSRHITEPLQFVPQIQNLYEAGVHIFVEAGPGRTLTTLVSKILANKPHAALCLDVPGRSGWSQLAALLAEAHNLQLPINLEPWFRGRRLQSMSTDDYLEKAEALANPPPHIWRVNGGRARPWHQKPTVKAEQKTTANRNGERPQDLQKSPSDAAPQTRQETSPTMSPNREHQTVEALNSKENGSPEPATNHNSESILGHVQNTMSQFFEMQREQQKVMNRFLDLQEQMLQLAMKNGDASLIKKSFRTSDHEGQAFGQTENRPLVPVLPKLKVKPAAPSVISPGPEQPGAKVTEPKGTSAPKTEASSLPAKSDDTNFEAVASTEEFKADLLATVCKRTGYPQDMLDLDAHLEGDLGLDSIKMVEIFSELREHHRVLQIQDQDRILEEVSTLNTLRGIIDWYDTNRINDEGNGAPTEQQASEAKTSIGDKSTTSGIEKKNRIQSRPEQTGTKEKDPALTSDPVRRFILKPEPAPLQPKSDSSTFPNDRLILVIGEAPQISAALHGALAAQNHRVRQIIPSKQTRALGDDRIEVDLSSEDSIHELRERLKTSGDTVGAIFNLLALIKDEATGSEDARGLFLLLKSFESDLKESARSGGGWIIHFTSMGGQFALKEATTQSFDQTGCIGLLKTVAREWQDVKVKCIDVDLNMEPHMLLAQTTQELLTQDDLIEVGLNSEGRWKIAVQPQPHSGQLSSLALDSDSVILVNGGGYGITAEMTKALAQTYQPNIVMVGRTPFPEEEAKELRELHHSESLKAFLIQEMKKNNGKATPAEIDRRLRNILKARQIRGNVKAIQSIGANVEYRALDVCDAQAFGQLLDDTYAKWGRLDGVIHGAGIIEDKLIKDKPADSFAKVFATKVVPARILADKLQPDSLKFLMFFSSVAGCFGNVGQADYSAANEVLNRLAIKLDRQWPAHVVSINWGPWDSGMVSDGLRKLYATRGIHLIPMEEGVRFFMQELGQNGKGTPLVVVTRSIEHIAGISPVQSAV